MNKTAGLIAHTPVENLLSLAYSFLFETIKRFLLFYI